MTTETKQLYRATLIDFGWLVLAFSIVLGALYIGIAWDI